MTTADIDCRISSSKPTGPPIPKCRRHTPQDGFADTIEHRGNENGISLPAQFLLESGRLVAQKDLTLSFRLADLTPIYVWNGATTDFDWKGSIPVAKDPSKSFGGFIRLNGGRYDQRVYPDWWPDPA